MLILNTRRGRQGIRALGICCLAITITAAAGAPEPKILRVPRREVKPLLISTVDWYKEPPQDPEQTPSSGRLAIPSKLIIGLSTRLHAEAIVLLGDADVVELTKEQAKHFGFQAEPDSVLRSLIQDNTEDIRRYQKEIDDLKAGRNPYYSPSTARIEAEGYERLVKGSNAEIRQYQGWLFRLKPYLIKGVVFSYRQQNFSGYLISRDLIITFGTVFEGNQSVALAMKRMPAVAYLPKKPQRVFTYMHNLD